MLTPLLLIAALFALFALSIAAGIFGRNDWLANLLARLRLGLAWRMQILVLMLFSLPALAQDAAAASPSPWSALLSSLLSPTGLAVILGIVGAGLTLFKGGNAALWKFRLALLIKHGFNVVEDLNSDPALKGKLDKEAAGLKAINDYCVANGWRSLKLGEVESAKLSFKALNGQAEAAEAIQTKALTAALAAAPKTADQAAALVAGLK